MSPRKFAFALVLAVIVLIGARFSYAQTTSGAIVGVVHDASGAVVPNSTVEAKSESTGIVYTGKANAAGEYRISNLPQGAYDLRTVVPVASEALKLNGAPTIYIKTGESGNERQQAFCPRCGSPIFSAPPGDGPKTYFIRVGTINQRDSFVPRSQIWARSQQRWVDGLTAVQKIEKQ